MIKALMAAAMLVGTTAGAASAVDASEVWPKTKKEAKKAEENARELGKQSGADEAFELEGTVQHASSNRLTVNRENLPQASLDVRPETEVMIDGQKAEAKDLKEGMEVRAHFQVEGRDPVAVKLEAKSPEQGMGGSGEAGKEMKQEKKDK